MSTPVQRQYWELKKQNPEALLFFRLGDFYELFYEDAQVGSRLLGLTLTARHRGTENEMPMCGFPHHAHQEYLEKLIEQGYKVAIAEQVEDEKTKAITRQVVRVVTPGTSLEEGTLKRDKPSLLVSIGREKNTFALAYSDFATGEFRTCLFENEVSFFDELYKLNPREILLSSDLFADEGWCQKLPKVHITPRKNLSSKNAAEVLKKHFGLEHLDVFGIEKITLLIVVSGQIVEYLAETQKIKASHISKLVRYDTSEIMQLDQQTYRHLEIFEPLYADENTATLWSVFEKSLTAMGARRLYSWLQNPLLSMIALQERQDALVELSGHVECHDILRENLARVCDLERILARLVTGKGNARDLAFFRDSFAVFPAISEIFKDFKSPFFLQRLACLSVFGSLYQVLSEKLVDHPPLEITVGGMFRDGVSEKLDELRRLTKNGQVWLDQFLEQKKQESGISSLKLKYSKNFGFCLEVSSAHKDKVPQSWIRRQTLVNAERFTTPELSEYEERALRAESESYELEHKLFEELRQKLLEYIEDIQQAAKALSEIDAVFILVRTALRWRWVCPEIIDNSSVLEIENGRHPVVEKITSEAFIANDLVMDGETSRMHLITGPNMAGKSTFLRQNALIILLAQIGSFVPAKKVRMGICDRIFTRVGASDNLAGGKSTFFVEMTETARILNAATERSFVILDEIGRGTSTFDGISLAWSITEFLHDQIKAKTLFATHYHELVDLVEKLRAGKNFHVTVSQNKDGIVFLRQIAEGGISDSFGIEVAKSAGLPKSVIEKAKQVLSRLESENLLSGQPHLFSFSRSHEKIVEIEKKSEVEMFLRKQNLDELTPKQALDTLFILRSLQEKKS